MIPEENTKYRTHHYIAGAQAAKDGITHCKHRRNNVAWKMWTQGNWDWWVANGYLDRNEKEGSK